MATTPACFCHHILRAPPNLPPELHQGLFCTHYSIDNITFTSRYTCRTREGRPPGAWPVRGRCVAGAWFVCRCVGSPRAAKTLHFTMRCVQNQTLGLHRLCVYILDGSVGSARSVHRKKVRKIAGLFFLPLPCIAAKS